MSLAGRRARAWAPGSIGNVGPGLDVLGLAVAGLGDEAEVTLTGAPGVRLLDPGHPDLPADPARHACALAVRAVLARAGAAGIGADVRARKGLPLSGGQGGSAASAVAAAVAADAALGAGLARVDLLEAALEAEAVVAGRHADNLAPSLLGGCVLVRALDPPDLVSLPVPAELTVVLAHPAQQLRTAEGRAALPREVPLEVVIHQMAQVAALAAAFALGDYDLLGRALDDRLAEPARAPLLPGFAAARRAALGAGALGASISGSGPTAFALARGAAVADAVAAAMRAAYAEAGVACVARVAAVDREGARVLERGEVRR